MAPRWPAGVLIFSPENFVSNICGSTRVMLVMLRFYNNTAELTGFSVVIRFIRRGTR